VYDYSYRTEPYGGGKKDICTNYTSRDPSKKNCAPDFPNPSGGKDVLKGCIEDDLKDTDVDGQLVPTLKKDLSDSMKKKCPISIETWFTKTNNKFTTDVPIRIMATKIQDNPPFYKVNEIPMFQPLSCPKAEGFGCADSRGSGKNICYKNPWDEPVSQCFNGYFAMSFHSWIYYNDQTQFFVLSDDDSWTFINYKLAADIGGTHKYNVTGATIDVPLNTLADKLNLQKKDTYYHFDLFYAERGAKESGLAFIISPVPFCSEHPDIQGCCDETIDSDSDGLPDCLDGCPHNGLRYGPGSCTCDDGPECEETKHCGLYTKDTCTSTNWSKENCALCNDICMPKTEAETQCPCSSFTSEADCPKDRCIFCGAGQTCVDASSKCLCSDASESQCSTNLARTRSNGPCNYCYNSLCQEASCLNCEDIKSQEYCTNDSRCTWCTEDEGFESKCAPKGSEGDETHFCTPKCDTPFYKENPSKIVERYCFDCGNDIIVDVYSKQCPKCSKYDGEKEKCNQSYQCSYCESTETCIDESKINECKSCSAVIEDIEDNEGKKNRV